MSTVTIAQLYEYAKLATAAYIMPKDEGENVTAQMGENMGNYIRGSNLDNRLPTILADAVFGMGDINNQKWSIPAGGYYDNDETGFAGTLYQNEAGEKVLALRGTEPKDIYNSEDLWVADIQGIGFDGFASDQTVQLINYIEKLKAVKGSTYQQLKLTTEQYIIGEPPEGCIILKKTKVLADPLGLTYSYTYLESHTLVATEDAVITEEDKGKITLTGHSLGGHLATMAKRLYPELFDDYL